MIRNLMRAAAALLLVALGLFASAQPAAANPEMPWYSETATICLDNNTGAAGFPIADAGERWSNKWTWMNIVEQSGCSLYGSTLTFNNVNNPDRPECIYWYMTFRPSTYNGWTVANRAIAYMNLAHPACWSSYQRKAHMVSVAIGYRLGMRVFSPTSISVMSNDTMLTMKWPETYDWDGLHDKQYRYGWR